MKGTAAVPRPTDWSRWTSSWRTPWASGTVPAGWRAVIYGDDGEVPAAGGRREQKGPVRLPRADSRRPRGRSVSRARSGRAEIPWRSSRWSCQDDTHRRGVAQRPERRSPKPDAAGSTPAAPATGHGCPARSHRVVCAGKWPSARLRASSRRPRAEAPPALDPGRLPTGSVTERCGPLLNQEGPTAGVLWRTRLTPVRVAVPIAGSAAVPVRPSGPTAWWSVRSRGSLRPSPA